MNDQGQEPVDVEQGEHRLPNRILNDPKVRAGIQEARARIRERKTRAGKTAEELTDLGHERHDVDA